MTIRISITSPLPKLRVPDAMPFPLPARFFDDSTDPWSECRPTTVDYRIDRVMRGEAQALSEVRGWTPVTPAQLVVIEITSADNDIPDDHTEAEFRRITVRANAGDPSEGQAAYNYCIE